MKKLIALLLVLVMVAGLVACAGSNDETKGNDTTNTENTADSNGDSNTGSGERGGSARIAGADAANGDRMVKAAQMAVDEVNAAGGLLGGRKVELVIQDDATDNAMAVNVANIFAGNDKISAVVGPWNSGMILAAEAFTRMRRSPSSASHQPQAP